MALEPGDARGRLAGYLSRRLAPEVKFSRFSDAFDTLKVVDVQRLDPGLWDIVGERRPRDLPMIGAVTYAVETWDDVSWTNPSVIGLRPLLLPRLPKEKLDAQGVLLRLRGPIRDGSSLPLMFMLWVAHTNQNDWKFAALGYPPTN